eukprot:566980-Prorocentrum_lima.AAC.1
MCTRQQHCRAEDKLLLRLLSRQRAQVKTFFVLLASTARPHEAEQAGRLCSCRRYADTTNSLSLIHISEPTRLDVI